MIFVSPENKHSQINPSPSQSWKCGLLYHTKLFSCAIKLKLDIQYNKQFDLQIVVSFFPSLNGISWGNILLSHTGTFRSTCLYWYSVLLSSSTIIQPACYQTDDVKYTLSRWQRPCLANQTTVDIFVQVFWGRWAVRLFILCSSWTRPPSELNSYYRTTSCCIIVKCTHSLNGRDSSWSDNWGYMYLNSYYRTTSCCNIVKCTLSPDGRDSS